MEHKQDLPGSFDEISSSGNKEGAQNELGLSHTVMARETSTVVEVQMGSQENKHLLVRASLRDNGTKDIGIAFVDEMKVTEVDGGEMAMMPTLDVVMSESEKIQRFLWTLKVDNAQRLGLQDGLMIKLQKLTKEFTDKAKKLVEAYNFEVGVQLGKSSDIQKEGRNLLVDKIIYIPKTQWTQMKEKKKNSTKRMGMFGNQQRNIAGQISVKGANGPAKLLDLARKSQNYTSIEAERKVHRAKEEAERQKLAEEDAKLAQQTSMAQLITEFFPYLSLDDAHVCIDCHKGDLQRIQNWLIDFEGNVELIKKAIQTRREIGMGKTINDKNTPDPVSQDAENELLPIPSFTRESSISLPPSLAFQIVEMSDENRTVTVQQLRDRNKVPLFSGPKATFLLEDFLKHKWYFADQEKFHENMGKRRLHIKYQIEKVSGDMIPISLRPVVPFNEYIMNWDNSTRKLNSVSHKQDGKVAFSCTETDSHIYDDAPILIYTQVVDDQTLNIVFIGITDTREEIRVDPVNITYTSKTVKDFFTEFKQDFGGNALNYRIIVKDGAVQAVLGSSKKGKPQREKFVEISVPRLGSYVTFKDGKKIGRLQSIPTGMIVTNKLSGAKRVPLHYKRRPGPENFGRHVSEIAGYVDIDVLLDGERLMYSNPNKEAWNVSEFKITEKVDQQKLEGLISEAESKKEKDGDLYEQKISQLSDLLKGNKSKSPEFFVSAQELMADIRKLSESEDVKKRGLVTKQNKALVMSFVRELRVLRLGVE